MYHYKARCLYDYYEVNKEVYTTKRLKFMPYAQSGVNIYEDGVFTVYELVSYETRILRIIGNKIIIMFNPCYSRSTIKHVSAFLHEYLPDVLYYDIKNAYIIGKDEILINGKRYVITRV